MSLMTPLPEIFDGRYEVQAVVGTGGMGAVYRGLDRLTGDIVAIKQLKPEVVALEPGLVERFAREAEALRQLQHPNIVKVLATFQENERHFIIMEYVAGGSLADLLEREPQLPVARVVSIALELSDALSRAHHLKIIHRDIKPANVLLAEDGTPRLTDFGVARVESMDRMTQTGASVGTLDYLSPEAINGESVDARADLWAFGVMLFEMLAGQRPFAGYTITQMLAAVLTQPPPDLLQLRPDAPPELVSLIGQMLVKDRDQRIASARLLGAELEAIAQGRKTTPPRSTATAPTRQPAPDTTPIVQVSMPVPAEQSPLVSAPSSSRRPPPVPVLAVVMLGLMVVIGLLVISGTLDGEINADPTAEMTLATSGASAAVQGSASPTAPTANRTAAAANDLALPEDWLRFSRNGVSIAAPSEWSDLTNTLNLDTILDLITSLAGDDPELVQLGAELRTMAESGLLKLAVGDLIALEGVVVIEEEIGLTLTPDLIELRIRDLMRDEFLMVGEFVPLELAAGGALSVLIQMDAESIRFNSYGYFIPIGTRLYWLMFSLPPVDSEAALAEQIALTTTIAQTFTVAPNQATLSAQPDADAAAEATAESIFAERVVVREPTLAQDPEGWMRYSIPEVSIAVPGNYVNLVGTGVIESMQDAFMTLGGSDPGITALSTQFTSAVAPGLLLNFGSLANLNALEGVAVYTEPTTFVVTPDLLRLRLEEIYSSDIFEITILETVQLPAGEALRVLVDANFGELRGTIYGYLLIRDDLLYTIIYLTNIGSDNEAFAEVIARYDLIAQSFQFRYGLTAGIFPETTPEGR